MQCAMAGACVSPLVHHCQNSHKLKCVGEMCIAKIKKKKKEQKRKKNLEMTVEYLLRVRENAMIPRKLYVGYFCIADRNRSRIDFQLARTKRLNFNYPV